MVRTAEFDVKVNSDYQFQFQLKRDTKVNDILVSLGDRGEFKVYADGMRIYAEKAPDREHSRTRRTSKNQR